MERNNSGSFQGGGRFSPLAIVGIGCRFPGGANDVETFWGMLEAGRSGIRETPEDRWDKGRYYNSDPSIPGVVISKWGGFVDNIDKFDARFWGLSPREAMRMDPQQRLLLEVAWEALEDAGTPPETIRGSRTGVFVGIASNDYSWLQMPYHEEVDAYTNSGNTGSIASNRISYLLDLKGPSSSVDTACSSALVAVWAACHSIWSGNCEAAIAGGVNVLLVPHASIGFSRASMLSPSGQCFAFDARANGYVRAEGAGAVFVKPLDRALADGDHIYATIRSAVCNQDGHTSSMTVPGVEGQSAMLRQAYAEAGVTPGRVVYMEAHGTGTPVGDPIEARALGNVLREGRPRGSKCLIGSVKTNIGHLEAGSGLPGLIKAALVLHKRVVPPSRNFEQPNPNIPFAELGLKVADQLQPLPVEPGQLPLAGVNSFGFGGTNAHVVLEAAPAVISPSVAPAERADRPYLLTVSARDDVALRESVERFRSFLDVQAPVLDAFCYSAGARREAHPQRLAFVGRTADELSESMRRWLQDPAQADSVVAGRVRGEAPPVVFVFTGQGAQWWGMGRELLVREPVFRRTLEQIDSLFQPLAGWSIIQELTRGEQDSRIDHTNIAQPAIFGLQVALAELWKSWGIQPSRVIGHSVGEVAAAYCAGIYTLNDAVRVIYHRSRLQNMTGGHGRMVAVGITAAEARQRIGAEGERVHIAVFNSPNLVTLAGDTEPLEGIVAQLEAEGKFVRWLRINYAFHTHQMEPICEELLGVLADIQPRPSQIPYVSTVTAGELAGEQLDALYWWRNVRQPVLFGPAIANMLQGEDVTFLELGPHPALASSLNEYVAAQGRSGRVFHSLKRHTDESREMLVNAARLHVSGTRLDWCAICQNDGQWLRLPPYPWNRERYWLESKDSWRDRAAPLDHPLLGLRVSAPLPTWRLKLHPGRLPYLRDHRFWDSIVFPGAGYAEMGIALARLLFPDEPHVVEDLEIKKAMFIGDEQLVQVQVVFDPSEKSFSVYSQVADKDEWDLHAQGKLTRVPAAVSATTDLAALQARLPDHFDHDRYYGEFAAAGYQFGPNFQHLQHVWRQQGEALAEIVVPEEVAETVDQYHFHPAVLDACFHIFKGVQVVPADAVPTDYFYLPHSIRRVRLYVDKPPTHLWAHAYLTQDDGHSLVSDIAVYDSQGRLVADILGFRADHVEQKRSADDVEQSCYQFRWEPRRLKGLGIEKPFSFASNAEVVADVRARTPEVRRARGLDSYTGQFIPRIEAIAGQYTQNAWLDLGWDPAVGEQCHLADLLVQLHILDTYERLARSHLTALAQHGILRSVGPDAWEVVRRLERRDPAPELEQLRSEFPRFATEADLHARTGPELAAVMTGATDPVRLLFPDGSGELLKHFYQEGMDFPALYDLMTAAVQRAIQGRSPRRALRVLEVGAGTGALTHALLPAFPPDVTEYRFTDVSPVLVSAAKGQLEGFPFVEFQSWDLEKEPASQSVPVQGFDLILASDVLHATADLRETLKHLRQCLAVGGRLMFLELTSRRPAWNNIFGLLSGWWRFQDDLRKDAPILSREQWHALLAECGFEDVTSFATACGSEHVEQEVFLASVGATPAAAGPAGAPTGASALGEAARVASSEPAPAGRGGFVLLADQGGRMQALAERLRARGYEAWCVAAADDYRQVDERTYCVSPRAAAQIQRVLESAAAAWGSLLGVVHGWSLDAPSAAELDAPTLGAVQHQGVLSALQLVHAEAALPERIWFVTREARQVAEGDRSDGLAASPLVGFARVANNELSRTRCLLVDLGNAPIEAAVDHLAHEILAGDGETEVAYRGDQRYVIRLHQVRPDDMPKLIRDAVRPDGTLVPYRLQTDKPGILTKLTLHETVRRDPGPHEIEIRVHAGGVNFRDVMKALGTYPGNPIDVLWFGDDFAGVVERVGDQVTQYRVGDRVAGMAPYAFRAFATVDKRMTFPLPDHLSYQEAATLPTVFLTAHYALNHLARMRKGEKVLIHAGTGGVGQAAIQIAQRLGLEIFATAGSDDKRQLLRDMGVQHVMSSRTLEFADQIRTITGGRGVDAVLNSLAGDFIPKSFSVLAPFGRFLEIGKIDIYRNAKIGLEALRNNVSYFIIDLAQHLLYQPEMVAEMFAELARRFAARDYRPLPHTVFPITKVVDAFRYMAQGKHVGKNVLDFDETQIPVAACTEDEHLFRAEATYLITGGAGGFGLEVAQWMVKHGARSVALMSRSGPREAGAVEAIERMRAKGVQVLDARGDVTRPEDVERVVQRIQAESLPLRGVVHGAMVLDDEFLAVLDEERFSRVLDPKMLGAWNLHQATRTLELDHFICFSSFSNVVGGPRQSNYNAGNVFLEALVQHRRAQGMPAQAICWGALLGAGFVERNQKTAQYLEKVGMKAFRIDEALRIMRHLVTHDPVQVAVCRADWRAFAKSTSTVATNPIFAAVAREHREAEKGGSLVSRLAATLPDARPRMVEEFMVGQVAAVFGADATKISSEAPLTSLGLDSLMAIELTNRIEGELGTAIPMGSLLNGPSIKDLAQIVLRQLEPELASSGDETQREAAATGPAPLEPTDHTLATFPLAASQQWSWRRQQDHIGRLGNRAFCVRSPRSLEVDVLRKAFAVLFERHPLLHVVFDEVEGEPVHRRRTDTIPDFHEFDCREYSEDQLRQLLGEHVARGLDARHGPVVRLELFRTPDEAHVLLLTALPLVVDAWSLTQLADELLTCYEELARGCEPSQERSAFAFEDYVVWQRAQFEQGGNAKGADFWKRHLAGAPLRVDLPIREHENGAIAGGQRDFVLDPQLSLRLLAATAEHDVSLYGTLLTAFQMALHSGTGQDDLLVLTTLPTRPHRELASVVGCVANPVVLRSRLAGDPHFAELLRQCRQQLTAVQEHQHFPLTQVFHAVSATGEAGTAPSLPTFLMERHVGHDPAGLSMCTTGQGGYACQHGAIALESASFPWLQTDSMLGMMVEEAGGQIRGCWRYARALLEPEVVEALHARFVAALEEICRRPFIPVSQAMPQDKIVARLATHSAADMSDRAGAVVTPAAERRTMPAASLFAGGGDTNYLAEARLDPSIEAPAGAIVDPSRRDRVFLTGATGFLGAFLLDDLLRMTDSRVYCLVRATSESKARDRILDNLARYRLHPAGVKERVVPIVGDLAEPRFGLSPEEFEQLGEQIDVIYHNGAIVNLVYPYPLLRRANVAGTEEVLRLATTGRLKPTHHVSTFWVQAADDGTHRQVVTEDDPLPPCEGLPIGYSRSKWVGEQMIAEARRRGIPVSIYRPGYVTGDSRTGVCNADDFLHAIVLACAQVRSVPQLDMNLEITPVDFVSRAIVQLSLQPQYLGNTYHLVNPHPLPLTMLADWMQTMGMKIRPVSYATWRSQLSELARGAPDELIAPLMSLLGPGDGVNPGWHPRYDCRRATEHLAESHIVCPPADDRLLATYHAYLREAGFLWDEPAASPRPVAGAMAAELRGSDVR